VGTRCFFARGGFVTSSGTTADGGAYTVYFDTDGNEVRNIDEIGREVDSAWDGRHRVVSRTFPEGDEEFFGYDLNDNVLSLVQMAKPGSGLANTVVTATYEPTWNHLATITDARGNTTSFAY
jgi:YD repeat-containing protein